MAGGAFMIAAIDRYLALRRCAGFVLSNAQYLLRSFAAFAADHQQRHIRTATVIEWASRAPSSAQRRTRYQTVRQFAEHVRMEDPQHDLPPPNHFGHRKSRRIPRIYTAAEIDQLILAATQLSRADAGRAEVAAWPHSRTGAAQPGAALSSAASMRGKAPPRRCGPGVARAHARTCTTRSLCAGRNACGPCVHHAPDGGCRAQPSCP